MPKPICIRRKTLMSSYIASLIIVAMCLLIAVFPVRAEENEEPSPADTPVQNDAAPPGVLGSKNPFKPFINTGMDVTKGQPTKVSLPISPLQRQDISMFNVVGISGNDQDGWKAIVEDNEKKFYIIKVGTPIGLAQGRISQITSDRVVIAVKDADSRGKINHITIKLHKDIEETP